MKNVTLEQMSSRQLYLLQTPVRLYIWLGKAVPSLKRQASLRIFTSFARHILDETLDYRPGYHFSREKKNMMLSIRLQFELEGNESRQFGSLLGKMTDFPCLDNRLDYLMLRLPKMTDQFDEDCEDVDGDDQEGAINPALVKALTMGSAALSSVTSTARGH